MARTLDEYLKRAAAFHGHLCSGQVLGVRMAKLGLELLGLADEANLRDLLVYVESDRCVADAAYAVTGATLGRRRLKWVDYGKTAMTLLDLKTNRAVRLHVKTPRRPGPGENVIAFWEGVSDEEAFYWAWVDIQPDPCDLPGKPQRMAQCEECGEQVLDGREVVQNGRTLCRACANGPYYRLADEAGNGDANGAQQMGAL